MGYNEDQVTPTASGPSLSDFVIVQKVNAFCDSYTPVEMEAKADEVFTDMKLRKYFQAYTQTIGDPLAIYIDLLDQRRFSLHTSICGEPALFVARKYTEATAIEQFWDANERTLSIESDDTD